MKLNHLSSMFLVFAAACGGTASTDLSSSDLREGPFSTGAAAITRTEAETRAVAIVSGDVVEVEQKLERGLTVFEVKIARPSGGIVEVKIDEASGQVVEIESEHGPFDFTLDPGNGFITFQAASDAALALHPGATITKFELELDDGLRWKYELILSVNGQLYKVELDARTGAVLKDRLESESGGDDSWDDDGSDDLNDDNGGDRDDDDSGRR